MRLNETEGIFTALENENIISISISLSSLLMYIVYLVYPYPFIHSVRITLLGKTWFYKLVSYNYSQLGKVSGKKIIIFMEFSMGGVGGVPPSVKIINFLKKYSGGKKNFKIV